MMWHGRLALTRAHRGRRVRGMVLSAASSLMLTWTFAGAAAPARPTPRAGIPSASRCELQHEDVRATRSPAGGGAVSSSDQTLRLNLPAFRLDVLTGAVVARTYPVAVGERRYRTPVGSFEVIRIIWNPWWYPPDSEWARDEKITPPGRDNPMGKVKLLLRGAYYLHGTPFPTSIGRAVSHGCIRMHNEDAIELARLVQETGWGDITPEATDSLVARFRPTRAVNLERPVPLEIVYDLVELRDTTVMIHPDIYRWLIGSMDGQILRALAGAGYDTTAVDRAALRAISRRQRTATDSIPLSHLIDSRSHSASRPRTTRRPASLPRVAVTTVH